jgi:hypothetical protein
MKILKIVYLTIIQIFRQVWLLPQTIAFALRQKRRQTSLNEHEVERLDRLRNPSKYMGR